MSPVREIAAALHDLGRNEDHGVADGANPRRFLRRNDRRWCRARRFDGAGGRRIASECRGTLFERCLPLKQCIEFFLELLLIEELATHDAVDLGAQFGNAILIRELHFGLPSH